MSRTKNQQMEINSWANELEAQAKSDRTQAKTLQSLRQALEDELVIRKLMRQDAKGVREKSYCLGKVHAISLMLILIKKGYK